MSNVSANASLPAAALLDWQLIPAALKHSLTALYVLVSVTGISFNGLVCFLFVTKKVEMNSFNTLLLNMAISDLAVGICIWPYILLDLQTFRDYSPQVSSILCALSIGNGAFWIANTVSTLLLMAISLFRYAAVKYPLKFHHVKWRPPVVASVTIWLFGILIMLPNLISFRYNSQDGTCIRQWPDHFDGKLYSVCGTLFGFVLPVGLMLFTFFSVRKILNAKIAVQKNQAAQVARRKKAGRLLFSLIIGFATCWTPFLIYWILSRIASVFPRGLDGRLMRMEALRFVVLFVLCNTVVNPVIYGLRDHEALTCMRGVMSRVRIFFERNKVEQAPTRDTVTRDTCTRPVIAQLPCTSQPQHQKERPILVT